MMIPYNAVVRVVQLTDLEYPDRDFSRLGVILLCDYRGSVRIPDVDFTLVSFTFPRWFDSDTSVTDGLTFLWVKNQDLEVVSLEFCDHPFLEAPPKLWVRHQVRQQVRLYNEPILL